MSEFAGEPVESRMHLAAGQDSCTDAFRDSYEDSVANSREPPIPGLSEQAGVGVVVHLDLQLQSLLQSGANVKISPVQVRRHKHALGFGMNSAGHTDPDSFE